jgi:AraC family transcriptional regulator of adaptative response/methylated-DNA-[protein]-cysteine methyltransferase
MREIIRFAWGISSLGDFMVAMSDRGLVTLEFSSDCYQRRELHLKSAV